MTHADRLAGLEYLAPKLGMTPADLVGSGPFELLIVRRAERIIGAIVYNNWRGRSIEAHWAGDRGWLTRGTLERMFRFPFEFLGVGRMVGAIPARNEHAAGIAERLGFVREGIAREAEDDGGDLILFGMLKRECRWLANG